MRHWMSRREAADYLSCSTDSIDRRLKPMKDGPERGKFRFVIIDDWGTKLSPVRIVAADVYAMLPIPDVVNETEVA